MYSAPTEMRLSGGLLINKEDANAKSINFDRIVQGLVMKMNRRQVDKMELSCLKALVLFNDDNDGLSRITSG